STLFLKRLIPVSVREGQPPQPSRRIYLDLYLVPLGFALDVRRIEPDRILVSQFQRYSCAYLDEFGFIVGIREEGASAGHPGDFFEDRAAKARQRIVGRIGYAYRVDLHVSFFDSVSQLLVGVAAVVILAVGDYQQRFLGLTPLLDLFNRQICCVVKRRRTVRVREHEVPEKVVARGGEVLNEFCSIVETDQEEIV